MTLHDDRLRWPDSDLSAEAEPETDDRAGAPVNGAAASTPATRPSAAAPAAATAAAATPTSRAAAGMDDEAPDSSSLIPAPNGWSDPLTRTDGPDLWFRLLATERARVQRYKRPVTVAFVELAGLDDLARRWGSDVAERALVNVARVLVRNARTSDHIARVRRSRFGVLLTETGEIAAINFVERARSACEREVGSVSLEFLRIGFGWASPPKGDLDEAVQLALARLADDVAGKTRR